MRNALAVTLPLLLGAVLAACGGGSSGGSGGGANHSHPPPVTGLTKANYVAKADPLCATAKRHAPLAKLDTLIAQFPTPTTAIAQLLRKTAVAVDRLVVGLSALAPPPGDGASIAQWIGQVRALGTLVRRGADEVAKGDLAAAFQTRTDIANATVAPLAFAEGYGMPACAKLGS